MQRALTWSSVLREHGFILLIKVPPSWRGCLVITGWVALFKKSKMVEESEMWAERTIIVISDESMLVLEKLSATADSLCYPDVK
jgi:hypothetical protein